MAEVLAGEGYATFGLPAMSLLSEKGGFSRGFREYRLDGLQSNEGVLKHRYHRSAEDTLSWTAEWLRRVSPPFFGWIHYFGTHKVAADLFDLPRQYRRTYSPYAQCYDGKVAFADQHFLAPLELELANLGLLDETIVILWSDHGECLHAVEHGPDWGHNWDLTEEVMRTVLIMRGPGLATGLKSTAIAQSIDVFPTVLDLLGLPALPQFEGESLAHGAQVHERVVHMENLCQGFLGVRRGRFKLVLSEANVDALHRSRLGWRLALMRKTAKQLLPTRLRKLLKQSGRSELGNWCTSRGQPEEIVARLLAKGDCRLYDLELDPDESDDLAAVLPEVVLDLKALLHETDNRAEPVLDIVMTDDERDELEDRLRARGYL
jgi:hypothetical protein